MAASQLEREWAGPYAQYRAAPHDPYHAEQMLRAVQPVLAQGVALYGRGNDSPLLRSRAKQIALKALRTYDPAQGKLKTHLLTHLRGLQRYGAQQAQPLAVPEQVALDSQALYHAEQELADRLGRAPSTQELAEHTQLSPRRIAHVRRKAGTALTESELAGRLAGDNEGEAFAAAAQLPPAVQSHAEFLYPDLSPIDQLILEHRLPMHGQPKLPLATLARRARISPSAVSQRAARLRAELDQFNELGVL